MILPFIRQRLNGQGASVSIPGTLTASITGSVLSGTSPLAVQFDATASSSTRVSDPFRQIIYNYNYGDTGSSGVGNWTHSGRARNSDNDGGAIAAHVYETPGSYTATLQVFDGYEIKTQTVNITVTDPDTVFPNINTVCISTDGSTGWGPAGCVYQTVLPTGTAWGNKRFLFKKGQDFLNLADGDKEIKIANGNDNVYIGSAGSGAQPILPHFKLGSGKPTSLKGDGTADIPCNWKFVDVNIRGFTVGASTDLHIHKCYITNTTNAELPSSGHNPISFGDEAYMFGTLNVALSTHRIAARLTISECDIVGVDADAGTLGYCAGKQMTYIGNTWSGTAIEHGLRTPFSWKLFDAHNSYRGRASIGGGKSRRTSRTSGFGSGDSVTVIDGVNFQYGGAGEGWKIASRYCIISDNIIGGLDDDNDPGYPLEVSTSSASTLETQGGSEDILVLRNRLNPSGVPNGTSERMAIAGRRFTYMNNVKGDGVSTPTTELNWKTTNTPNDWKGPYYTLRS